MTTEITNEAERINKGADAIKALALYMVDARAPMDEFIRAVRKTYMRAAIVRAKGNMVHAAQLVGVHRNTVSRILSAAEKKDAVERAKNGQGL